MEAVSDWIVGVMMTVFGLIGLGMASHARDDEIYVFGLSLFAFAVVFTLGQVRAHYDSRQKVAVHV